MIAKHEKDSDEEDLDEEELEEEEEVEDIEETTSEKWDKILRATKKKMSELVTIDIPDDGKTPIKEDIKENVKDLIKSIDW